MKLTTANVLSLIVSTGVFSALVTQGFSRFFDWIKARAEMKRSAKYSASRLACVLESFAVDCLSQIESNEEFVWGEISANVDDTDFSLPELFPYPSEVDWQSLELDLMGKVLSFPNVVVLGNRDVVNAKYEPNVYGQPNHISNLACGYCGWLAWGIAEELRVTYRLPPSQAVPDAAVLECLQGESKEYVTFKARHINSIQSS